jgi:hypothetical protein
MRPTASRVAIPLVGLGLTFVLTAGCGESPRECRALSAECPATVPSYAAQIAPIISARCASCHNTDEPSNPWPLDNVGEIADWRSHFLHELETCSMPPPDSGKSLPEDERALLYAWLSCGAPDN